MVAVLQKRQPCEQPTWCHKLMGQLWKDVVKNDESFGLGGSTLVEFNSTGFQPNSLTSQKLFVQRIGRQVALERLRTAIRSGLRLSTPEY